jgi:hypothetical protein
MDYHGTHKHPKVSVGWRRTRIHPFVTDRLTARLT